MTINWPKLPENSTVIYEHADEDCPQRVILTKTEKGFRLIFAIKLDPDKEAPDITAEQIVIMANEMLRLADEAGARL